MGMQKRNIRSIIYDYIIIVIGTTLLALAINLFFDPLGMVIGGVTGIAIIIKEITSGLFEGGIPIWITNLVINAPLFGVAITVKGKNFGVRSLFATLYLSLALFITQWIPSITSDMLLGAVFGSILAGSGLGLIFMAQSTTGGTDLAASIVQHFVKFLSIAKLMLIMDTVIIAAGFFVFGADNTFYALIAVYIITRVIDAILDGLNYAKAALIICEKEAEITQALFEQLDRGITGLYGEGMYTHISKTILLCVVKQRQIVRLKEIVRQIDPKAFVIVADVKEVLGEGFIEQ